MHFILLFTFGDDFWILSLVRNYSLKNTNYLISRQIMLFLIITSFFCLAIVCCCMLMLIYTHLWDDELGWIVENTKGKGCKRSLMKLVVAETVYRVWFVRNRIIFQGGKKEELHWETIKNVILRRVENNRKLMMYCNRNL